MFYTGVLRTLILSAFLLLMVKTVDMAIMASTNSPNGLLFTESHAKDEKKKEDKKDTHKKEEKKDDHKKEEKKGDHAKPDKKEGDAPAEETTEEKPVSVDEVKTYTDAELEVLERLSERRDRLLKWEKDLQVKENVLKITEEKLDTKIEELRKLKKDVEVSLAEYRKEEDAKTKSLVKIYESMKPKAAADILSKMRIEDVAPLIDKMKEDGAGQIMSKMDPKIAKDITNKLNDTGKIRNSNSNVAK
jgi:flagellar motility protein MotE (MotC chaperone)